MSQEVKTSTTQLEKLDAGIREKRNLLRADRLDVSFGELKNLYYSNDLIISPEFQRSFRWDAEQKSAFIESLIVGLPIPPIFVAEDDEGKWELVDGLQRLSTVFSFFGELKNIPENDDKINLFKLEKCRLIEELNGLDKETLPVKIRVGILRAVCRVEILRWDSSIAGKYELFKRLNAGGEPLTGQEIRNAVFIEKARDLILLCRELGEKQDFINLLKLTPKQKIERLNEELILRYFFLRYGSINTGLSLQDNLDKFTEKTFPGLTLNLNKEKDIFLRIILLWKERLSAKDFHAPNGPLKTSLYEVVAYVTGEHLAYYENHIQEFIDKFTKLKNDTEFKAVGNSSFAVARVQKRKEIAENIFKPSN